MTDVSPRARDILDAIERDVQDRRLAMTSGAHGALAGAELLRAARRQAPRPLRDATAAAATSGVIARHDARRLLELVDVVVEQTERAQQRLAALDSAVTALSLRLGVDLPEPVASADRLPPPRVLRSTPQPTSTDGARLVAIEMAVAGFTRAEVSDRLTREYGTADLENILDGVFGAGSDGQSRMPWGAV